MAAERPADHQGIAERDIRDALASRSAKELAGFLRKAMRENRTVRRKVLAWLIDADADTLPPQAVQGELRAWIDSVFEQRSLMPRPPDLRELAPVRSAVRHRPDLAVPACLAILDAIADFLDAYGGGPQSLYTGFLRTFAEAAAFLAAVTDPDLRVAWLDELDGLSSKGEDLGYGLGRQTADILREVRASLGATPS